jgi:putative NADH-flavin reductase
MKVLIVGGAGKTGRKVVDEALKQGHQVTAFVHSNAGYDVLGVEVRTGDASDTAAMEGAIEGQDAVIDTVGGKTPYKHTMLETSVAATIIAAMQRQGVRRLVVTSSLGLGHSYANTTPLFKALVATFLRGAQRDKAGTEAEVRASDLDWIITRPATLNDKPATGEVRIFSADSRDRAHSITRSDLAAFLVAQLTSDEHLRQTVTIANR